MPFVVCKHGISGHCLTKDTALDATCMRIYGYQDKIMVISNNSVCNHCQANTDVLPVHVFYSVKYNFLVNRVSYSCLPMNLTL